MLDVGYGQDEVPFFPPMLRIPGVSGSACDALDTNLGRYHNAVQSILWWHSCIQLIDQSMCTAP